MMKYYISGPMTSIANMNYEAFFDMEKALIKLGHEVCNPARHGFNSKKSWKDYIKIDIKDMLDCDGVVTLPNWHKSKGASLEVYIATIINMPIFKLRDRELKPLRLFKIRLCSIRNMLNRLIITN